MKKIKLLHISGFMVFSTVNAFAHYTPEFGSAERNTITGTLQIPVKIELKKNVILEDVCLRVLGKWSVVDSPTPLTTGGNKVDYHGSISKYDKYVNDGGANPIIIPKKISETNRAQKTSLSIRYPQISGTSADADFNRLSLQIVQKHIANFKKDLDKPDRNTRTRELSIGYTLSFLDNRIVSISFDAGTDTGGAHPNSYTFVLNYDLKDHRTLALGDLFKANSVYLQTISDYCIRRIKSKGVGDDESIRNGAGPSIDNYQNWTINRRGISITFNAYQVASYAEGPQFVDVPFTMIRNLISKDSPIEHLVK